MCKSSPAERQEQGEKRCQGRDFVLEGRGVPKVTIMLLVLSPEAGTFRSIFEERFEKMGDECQGSRKRSDYSKGSVTKTTVRRSVLSRLLPCFRGGRCRNLGGSRRSLPFSAERRSK